MQVKNEAPDWVVDWSGRIREAPLGVLILGALLFFVGAGLILGGLYLALARPDTGWIPWVGILVFGPLVLYLCLHLLQRSHWAWLALVLLIAFLVLSSASRAMQEGEFPLAPLGEMAVEAGVLLYLARRSVRRAFGWS